MGIYAERDHKAEGDSGWITGAIQLRRIYDALHVYFLCFFIECCFDELVRRFLQFF
jgi:hypothetical protein